MHDHRLLLCRPNRWQSLDRDSIVVESADWSFSRSPCTRHRLHPCSDCGDRMHDIGNVIAVRFSAPGRTATACENKTGSRAPARDRRRRQRAQRARRLADDGDAYHAWYGVAARTTAALDPTRAGSGGAARPSTGMPSNEAPCMLATAWPYRPVHHPAPEELAAPPSTVQRGAWSRATRAAATSASASSAREAELALLFMA